MDSQRTLRKLDQDENPALPRLSVIAYSIISLLPSNLRAALAT